MKTVADFQREATPGSIWRCEHLQRPGASGTRTIIRGKTVLSYSFKNADGREGINGRLEIPKASEAIIDGNSVAFRDGPQGPVIFIWRKVSP